MAIINLIGITTKPFPFCFLMNTGKAYFSARFLPYSFLEKDSYAQKCNIMMIMLLIHFFIF